MLIFRPRLCTKLNLFHKSRLKLNITILSLLNRTKIPITSKYISTIFRNPWWHRGKHGKHTHETYKRNTSLNTRYNHPILIQVFKNNYKHCTKVFCVFSSFFFLLTFQQQPGSFGEFPALKVKEEPTHTPWSHRHSVS